MSSRIRKAASDPTSDSSNPVVSLLAEPLTAIAEDGTQKLAFVIKLSKPAPTGGLLVNLSAFDTDGQSGDESITTENIDLLNLGSNNTPTSVLIKGGADTARIILTPIQDTVNEAEETTLMRLRSGQGYTIDPVQNFASGTITDLPIVSVTADPSAPLAEDGNQAGSFIIRLSKPAPVGGLELNLATFDSDAQAGDETTSYTGITGFKTVGNSLTGVTIAPGATEARVTLTPVRDNVTEGEEISSLLLKAGNGYTINQTQKAASITITDLPVVSITTDATAPLAEGGKQSASFIIKLSKPAPTNGLALKLNAFDTDGKTGDETLTATGIVEQLTGNVIPTQLTIAPGATEARITFTPKADQDPEGLETSFLVVQESAAYTVDPSQGVASIAINDGTVVGTAQDDNLRGAGGRDTILGLGGNDTIVSLRGADLLDGGIGKNTLSGGKGRDRFVLNLNGLATITDFEDRRDRLVLSDGLTLGSLRISQRGEDTLIRSGNKQIGVLQGINADLISKSADFAQL